MPSNAAGGRGRTAATIYQVAQRAGVSVATVSRVHRGGTRVAPGTRQRVLRAIEELRYRPSQLGRSLAEGRHEATGIVFPDMSGPYYSEVILGYEEAAAGSGQSVLILATHGRPSARELVLDLAARVDGVVLMGRTVEDDLVARLGEQGMPVVLLARRPAGTADVVRSENRASAEALTAHLLGDGYRSLAFIGDPDASPDASARWRGFVAAHQRLDLEAPRAAVVCSYRESDGRTAVKPLLAGDDRPDGLVCANDEIALGAYAAARQAGLRVGVDVAVTGWDDIPAARLVDPPLTTVRQPMRELGSTAARMLIERIEEPHREPRRAVLPTTPVIRGSCGCDPRGS